MCRPACGSRLVLVKQLMCKLRLGWYCHRLVIMSYPSNKHPIAANCYPPTPEPDTHTNTHPLTHPTANATSDRSWVKPNWTDPNSYHKNLGSHNMATTCYIEKKFTIITKFSWCITYWLLKRGQNSSIFIKGSWEIGEKHKISSKFHTMLQIWIKNWKFTL